MGQIGREEGKKKIRRCFGDFCPQGAAQDPLLRVEGRTPRSVLGPDLCPRFHSSHSRLPPSLAFSSPSRAAGLRDELRGGKCNPPTPRGPAVCSGPPRQSGAAGGSWPAYRWGGIRENARPAWTPGGPLRFRSGVSALRSNEASHFFLFFFLFMGPVIQSICTLVVVVYFEKNLNKYCPSAKMQIAKYIADNHIPFIQLQTAYLESCMGLGSDENTNPRPQIAPPLACSVYTCFVRPLRQVLMTYFVKSA